MTPKQVQVAGPLQTVGVQTTDSSSNAAQVGLIYPEDPTSEPKRNPDRVYLSSRGREQVPAAEAKAFVLKASRESQGQMPWFMTRREAEHHQVRAPLDC